MKMLSGTRGDLSSAHEAHKAIAVKSDRWCGCSHMLSSQEADGTTGPRPWGVIAATIPSIHTLSVLVGNVPYADQERLWVAVNQGQIE
jgi:hypothetical protein